VTEGGGDARARPFFYSLTLSAPPARSSFIFGGRVFLLFAAGGWIFPSFPRCSGREGNGFFLITRELLRSSSYFFSLFPPCGGSMRPRHPFYPLRGTLFFSSADKTFPISLVFASAAAPPLCLKRTRREAFPFSLFPFGSEAFSGGGICFGFFPSQFRWSFSFFSLSPCRCRRALDAIQPRASLFFLSPFLRSRPPFPLTANRTSSPPFFPTRQIVSSFFFFFFFFFPLLQN